MRVTEKGQVTIPIEIRTKHEIDPLSEVEFVEDEETGRVYLVKVKTAQFSRPSKFAQLRGASKIKLSTEEILNLTRGGGRR